MSNDVNTKLEEAFWEIYEGSLEQGESMDLDDMFQYMMENLK